LDDTNTVRVLERDERWTSEDLSSGSAVTIELVGVYLAYLCAIGFIFPPPSGASGIQALPKAEVSKEQQQALENVGGRGALT